MALGKAITKRKLYFLEKVHGMKVIGIHSKNRLEWMMTDWSCVLFGLTSIPLYDTLGIENISYCLNQTEMTTTFVSKDTLKIILGLKDIGRLTTVISYDKI
jgi:long-chain acyl-CoA synthetase